MKCEDFQGRKREICQGHFNDGTPLNMSEDLRQKYIQMWSSGKTKPRRSRGLGDTVAKIARAIGLESLTKWFTKKTGKKCGCKQRQDKLNKLVPYKTCNIKPSPGLMFQQNRKIHSWAVGITTAPRSQHRTIVQCVDSVIRNGWRPKVFAEPGTDISGVRAEVVHREYRHGIWHNWKSMSEQLLADNPDAEFILTIQDDTVFHPQARWFAEHCFPVHYDTVFSFYTPRHYGTVADLVDENGVTQFEGLAYQKARSLMTNHRRKLGWKFRARDKPVGMHRIRTRSLWGACAMAFPRALLEEILDTDICRNWKGHKSKKQTWKEWNELRIKEPWRIQNSDTAIGKAMTHLRLEYWCPVPSLANHVAIASADDVGHGGNKGLRNAEWVAQGDLRSTFKKELAELGIVA